MQPTSNKKAITTSLARRFGFGLVLFAAALGGCSTDADRAENSAETKERTSAVDPLAAVRWATRIADSPDMDVDPLVNESGGSWACASCHGSDGEGDDQIPALAGLPAGYIAKQLEDFANGSRQNADMAYVAGHLSDEEMMALGRHYAAMTREAPAGASLEGRIERGRTLAISGDWRVSAPACFSCHGSSGWGVGQAFPPISGQHPAYLYGQLLAFDAGRRHNDPDTLMQDVARVLSDADMRAVADYLATRPPRQVAGGVAFGNQSEHISDDEPSQEGASK